MKKSMITVAILSAISSSVFAESWGQGTSATGENAQAWGELTRATARESTAWGNTTQATGRSSTAWGEASVASGSVSTAMGRSRAIGTYSVSAGLGTQARAYNEFVTGSFNVQFPGIDGNARDDNDPIFVVGNGFFDPATLITNYSNALTIFRNGTTTIDGNLVVNGNIASTSDERLKSNIEPFLSSDDIVMALEPVSYTLDNDKEQKTQIGFIAQDVEKVLPEIVNHSFLLDDYKSIDYSKLTVVLVGAIQTLRNENQQLKEAVCELNSKAEICL